MASMACIAAIPPDSGRRYSDTQPMDRISLKDDDRDDEEDHENKLMDLELLWESKRNDPFNLAALTSGREVATALQRGNQNGNMRQQLKRLSGNRKFQTQGWRKRSISQ